MAWKGEARRKDAWNVRKRREKVTAFLEERAEE